MATTPRIVNAAGLVETLVTTADAPARDRILLEAIFASGLAAGVALWRPLGRTGASQWSRLLSRGSLDRVPSRAELEAVERGERPSELAADRHVLLTGRGEGRVALTLGGFRAGEDELDRLEALLTVLAVLDPPAPTTWMQRMPSLLPRRNHDAKVWGQALLEHLRAEPPIDGRDAQPTEEPRLQRGRPSELVEEEEPAPPVAAVRCGLARSQSWLAEQGLAARLVVRGRLEVPTRVPATVLADLVSELLLGVRCSGADPGADRGLLRLGLREESSAWHLRIAQVPDDRGPSPPLRFQHLELPIGAPRPAEHVLVRFLAAGGVLRAQGSSGEPSGWFLRLPKPHPRP